MNLSLRNLNRVMMVRNQFGCRCLSNVDVIRVGPSPHRVKQIRKMRTEKLIRFDQRLSDTFGTLGADDHRLKRLSTEELEEDDDNYDVLEIKRGPKMAEIGYRKALSELIYKKPIQLTKALQMYNKMVSEDRIAPSKPVYTLMITGCAKVGYTEKAFEFFEELTKYKLKPSHQCITSLFNACAECPFPDMGLEKAHYLREWMRLESVEPNIQNYHSMIKAFGKLGQIETAFQLLEEMASKGHKFDGYTFSMLMMACISNRESGLFAAIKVIRQFVSRGMPMSIHIFNLLLRTVRDCGIGSEDNLNSLLDWVDVSRSQSITESNAKSIGKLVQRSDSSSNGHQQSLVSPTPNLLLQSVDRQLIQVKFNALSRSHNRLMLLGGVEGFIKMMVDFKITPDIKSVTLLAEISDFNEIAPDEILNLLDRFKIKADTDFFNILIKKICIQKGLIVAQQMLSLMTARGLQPNIMTFGVLALGCNRYEFGSKLLKDMEELNIVANIEIMGALMSKACHKNNIVYINHLLDYMEKNEIRGDHRLVEQLEVVNVTLQRMVASYERNGNNTAMSDHIKNDKFRDNFAQFKTKFNRILESTIEESDHPWKQFQFQEIANKKGMHSFVKLMKNKIKKRRAIRDDLISEFEEDQLYNE